MSLEPGNADSDKNMLPWQEMDRLEKIIDKHTIALEELANKVVNLANKLEEHMLERDAHNPGTMRTK
jgi:hypothetical protein